MKLLLALTYLTLMCFNPDPCRSTTSCQDDEELDEAITAEMNRSDIPSIAACIIKNDEIVWSDAWGYANIEKKKPASLDAIYLIASVSKLVTAVAVLQLYERGILDIDEDINRYLPFPVRSPRYPGSIITPRILLTHRSGLAWPNGEDPDFYRIYAGDSAPDLGEWLRNYIVPSGNNYNPNIWKSTEPGKVELYSNIGAALLGYLVEVVSKSDFSTYCENNIFKPLNMPNTSFRLSRLNKELLAMPYYQNLAPCGHFSVAFYPSTTVRSPISEFSRFIIAIMNGGACGDVRILREQTVKEMLRVQHPNSWLGLLWWKWEGDWFGGNGGFRGASSLAIFQKTHKVAILIFSNRTELGSFYPPDGRIYRLIHEKAMKFIE